MYNWCSHLTTDYPLYNFILLYAFHKRNLYCLGWLQYWRHLGLLFNVPSKYYIPSTYIIIITTDRCCYYYHCNVSITPSYLIPITLVHYFSHTLTTECCIWYYPYKINTGIITIPLIWHFCCLLFKLTLVFCYHLILN